MIRRSRLEDWQQIKPLIEDAYASEWERKLAEKLQNRKTFELPLALVEEMEGIIRGYTLLTPFYAYVNEVKLKALHLAILAVLPQFQNQGLGKALVLEAIEQAKAAGYDYLFLWGPPAYFAPLGFVGHCFGFNEVSLCLDQLDEKHIIHTWKEVEASDLQSLHNIWQAQYQAINLAIEPSNSLSDWLCDGDGVDMRVQMVDGEVTGYLRYEKGDPTKVQQVIMRDQECFYSFLAEWKLKYGLRSLDLPLSESAATQKLLEEFNPLFLVRTSPACMIYPLENQIIVDYCNAISKRAIPPGQIILPACYDF